MKKITFALILSFVLNLVASYHIYQNYIETNERRKREYIDMLVSIHMVEHSLSTYIDSKDPIWIHQVSSYASSTIPHTDFYHFEYRNQLGSDLSHYLREYFDTLSIEVRKKVEPKVLEQVDKDLEGLIKLMMPNGVYPRYALDEQRDKEILKKLKEMLRNTDFI